MKKSRNTIITIIASILLVGAGFLSTFLFLYIYKPEMTAKELSVDNVGFWYIFVVVILFIITGYHMIRYSPEVIVTDKEIQDKIDEKATEIVKESLYKALQAYKNERL